MPVKKAVKKTIKKVASHHRPISPVIGTAVGSEAAYRRYLPQVEKLAKSEVLPYRLDPVLAYHNVREGVAAVEPHAPELRRALPLLDHKAVLDLPALCQALLFAATQVDDKPRSDGETKTLLGE